MTKRRATRFLSSILRIAVLVAAFFLLKIYRRWTKGNTRPQFCSENRRAKVATVFPSKNWQNDRTKGKTRPGASASVAAQEDEKIPAWRGGARRDLHVGAVRAEGVPEVAPRQRPGGGAAGGRPAVVLLHEPGRALRLVQRAPGEGQQTQAHEVRVQSAAPGRARHGQDVWLPAVSMPLAPDKEQDVSPSPSPSPVPSPRPLPLRSLTCPSPTLKRILPETNGNVCNADYPFTSTEHNEEVASKPNFASRSLRAGSPLNVGDGRGTGAGEEPGPVPFRPSSPRVLIGQGRACSQATLPDNNFKKTSQCSFNYTSDTPAQWTTV